MRAEPNDKHNGSGDGPVFEHSILFGNGWELTIRFTRFNYSRYRPLFPITSRGGRLPGVAPLSQTA